MKQASRHSHLLLLLSCKEKVGGWNNKDCKRKKQSRKHTLKDKYNIIQKEIFEKKFKELNTNLFYLIKYSDISWFYTMQDRITFVKLMIDIVNKEIINN